MDAEKAFKRSVCLKLETIDAAAAGNNDVTDDDWLGGAAVVPGEEFSIDDLLDFSNGQLEQEEKDSLSVSSPDGVRVDDDSNSNSGSFSGNGEESDSLLGSELHVPVEDIAEELEWVSQFVDDSSPLHHHSPPPPNFLTWKPEPTSIVVYHSMLVSSLKPPCFPSPIPVKTRSKRSRSSRNKKQTTPSSPSTSSWSSDMLKSVTVPKPLFQRRCSHCLVHRTPQWRTGPLGPKTLCNACGVRYKSGRLFPEYRPACSPTFAVEIHSNSHRKVLEMRRKKESGFAPMVSSF